MARISWSVVLWCAVRGRLAMAGAKVRMHVPRGFMIPPWKWGPESSSRGRCRPAGSHALRWGRFCCWIPSGRGVCAPRGNHVKRVSLRNSYAVRPRLGYAVLCGREPTCPISGRVWWAAAGSRCMRLSMIKYGSARLACRAFLGCAGAVLAQAPRGVKEVASAGFRAPSRANEGRCTRCRWCRWSCLSRRPLLRRRLVLDGRVISCGPSLHELRGGPLLCGARGSGAICSRRAGRGQCPSGSGRW
jgi:hypothetical protein